MVDWYRPGFKAGGPIRSAANFADQLENDLDIYVFTTDRDFGELEPYSDIILNKWIPLCNHHVFYASPENLSWNKILSILEDVNADMVYLNSMFSRFFAIYPLLMKRLGKITAKVVLAPRGMLKDSAIETKTVKKKIFLHLIKLFSIPAQVTFHATDDTEKNDIYKQFGNNIKLFKAGNLPGKQSEFVPPEFKKRGELKIIFIGRIHPIKNLDFLLYTFETIKANVELTVVATLEDVVYWQSCKRIMESLPKNISVKLLQDLPHENIDALITQHHIFALPTKGENFGHSIFEALAAGRPILISDQTPWQNLETKMAGWVIPLSDKHKFTSVIQETAAMDLEELTVWCRSAWNHAFDYLQTTTDKQTYLKIFN